MAKEPKKCIFCQRYGMSKEHFWPSWMGKLVSEGADKSHSHEVHDGKAKTELDLKKQAIRQGDVSTKKIRVVCEKCNNGWMSVLEEKAKPLLVRLMNNEKTLLSDNDQELLAQWIVMKSIVAEHSERKINVTPESDRREFYRNLLIPEYFQIFISQQNSAQKAGFLRHSLTLSSSKDGPDPPLNGLNRNTQSVTFICGSLFIHVLACRAKNLKIEECFDLSRLEKLWPLINRDISWPVEVVLTQNQMSSYIHSLGRLVNHPSVVYRSNWR